MSILNVSEKSMARVMECLGLDHITLARLRKTSYRLNQSAQKHELDKITAASISFSCQKDSLAFGRQNNNVMSFSVSITVEPKKAVKTSTKEDRMYSFRDQKMKGAMVKKSPQIEGDQNRVMKAVYKEMKEAFKYVKQVDKLFIDDSDNMGIVMNSTFLQKLKEYKDTIKDVTCLKMVAPCQLTMPELEELFSLMKLKDLSLGSTLVGFSVTNELIAPLRSISIGEKSFHRGNNPVTALNDEILATWKENMPSKIHIKAETSFTFTAIWDFIQFIVEKRKNDQTLPSDFCFGQIRQTDEDLNAVALAQKERNFEWAPNRHFEFMGAGNIRNIMITYQKNVPNKKCTFNIDLA